MIKLPKSINKVITCALLVWYMLISAIYFVGCWTFVAFSAFCEIIGFDFRFSLTRLWIKEMQTFKEYIKDLKDAIEEIRKTIRR